MWVIEQRYFYKECVLVAKRVREEAIVGVEAKTKRVLAKDVHQI